MKIKEYLNEKKISNEDVGSFISSNGMGYALELGIDFIKVLKTENSPGNGNKLKMQ